MGIDVLGPLSIEGDQKTLGRRDRVVVAALAVHPGEVVSAERLADALWGEVLPASWPKVVQGCVMRLRKVLGPHAIETVPLGYRLAVPLDEIDAQRFDRAVARARDLLAAGEPERSALVLADALTLWRGPPLTELDSWDTARIEASRLIELRHAAEELYVEAALRSGRHDNVLAKAQALVAEEPLRERRWILLATAQYQSGRQSEALRTIRRLRTVLNRDLGLDPNPAIDALEQAILQQDPSLVAESVLPEPSPVCPYPGLKPYDVDDADGFFGRDADIAACLHKLSEESVVAVVGPSGCGKSSLVRAGVAAALQRDGLRVVVMTPGLHPLAAMAAALPGAGSSPVLLVDQCEEVFSLCQDADERARFLTALSAHRAAAPVIMSMRADRLADVSSHPGFARIVERGLHLLPGMTPPDLRAAIEEPARLASLVIEPGLVDLLTNEVADQPGALPLMSHALRETWQRREGRTLSVAGYNASGGIRGAVAQSAEEVHERIPADQRQVLRDLFLRLVAPGPDGDPVRSRLPRRVVVVRPEDNVMIDRLVAARLVTSDAGVVELAHESLVRAWPRLRGWLEEDVEGRRILHHLAGAADAWNNLGRPGSELYRGVRLAKALDWQDRTTPTLTLAEEEFLAASKRLSETELHKAESQARLQLRINRRLRAALVAGAFLLVGALTAGLVAVRQADRAEQAATSELARQVGARALLTEDISQSLLLATQGVRLNDSPETRANLVAAMNARPLLVRSAPAPLGLIDFLEVSPDGHRIVSGDNNVTIHLYDARSGDVLHSYSFGPVVADEHADIFTKARFSPDGRLVAALAGSAEETLDPRWPLVLLSAQTLEPVTPQPILPQMDELRFDSLTFSADGRYLAAGVYGASYYSDAFGLVWDLRALGRPPHKVPLTTASQSVVLSPDGHTIYGQWPLTAYDVATGKRLWQRPDLLGGPYFDTAIGPPTAALTKRGDLLAFQHPGPDRSDRTTTTLVNARTGKTLRVLRSQTDPPRDMAFSGDGKLLATAQSGGEVVIWEVASGVPRLRLKTTEASWAVAFSPDARRLYTGGDDGILRIYDLGGQRPYLRSTQAVPPRQYLHVLASDNGQKTAYLWRDGKSSWVRIADATTGTMTTPTRLDIELQPVSRTPAAWHPNGQELIVHDLETIKIIDARTGKIRKEQDIPVSAVGYIDHGKRIVTSKTEGTAYFDPELSPLGATYTFTTDCCVASSKDGETAALFKDDNGVSRENWRIVRAATGADIRGGGLPVRLNSTTYSPDGRLIAVTGADGAVLTIDTRSGEVKRAAATGHTDEGISIRFSPDGTRIVSGAADGTVSLWDAHTLDLLGTVAASTEGKPVAVHATFTGGGSDIVTIAAYDGKTYQWDTRINQTIAHACAMAGRNLTAAEWAQAFGNRPYEKTCP
ncbi:BTAD domain-containing putative transcriptional regulator [Kribbella sp. VKM Ac-2566]|uniref:nSTAND1 domain-containing NTPase n=1 Tax=Kribbella sp. VKM Ac-2566 TaxID=2512218 RepID=UPI001416F1DA|nr:BTAD domain-containing putative transcriptional regulator [Kribbella sp. VKM Ac-2566]